MRKAVIIRDKNINPLFSIEKELKHNKANGKMLNGKAIYSYNWDNIPYHIYFLLSNVDGSILKESKDLNLLVSLSNNSDIIQNEENYKKSLLIGSE